MGKLVQQYHAGGTNEGETVLLGHPARSEFTEWDGANVYRFEDEVVVEAWWHYDMLGLLRQLGVI